MVLMLRSCYYWRNCIADRRRRGSPNRYCCFLRCSIHISSFLLFSFFLSVSVLICSTFRLDIDSLSSLWYAIQVFSWIIRTRHQWRVVDFSEAHNDETSASNYLLSIEYRKILRRRTIRRNEILSISILSWSLYICQSMEKSKDL